MKKEIKKVPTIRFHGFTEDWEQRKVSEVAFVSTGFPFDSKDFSDDGNFLVITNGNIQDTSPVVDDSLGNRISIDDNKIKSAYLLNIGDILVTMDGTVGRTAKVIMNGQILAQRVGRLKAFNSGNFLYQWLNTGTFSKEMSALSHGGTIKHISLDEIRSYEAMMPQNSDEQEKIGKYFDSLDNLITLHQRKFDQLKMAKTYFLQNMFPAKGEKVPRIRFHGFTGDWEQRKLSDCAGFRRGSFPQPYGNKDWYDGEGAMPFVQVADVSSDMRLVKDTKQKISKLAQPMSVFAEKGSVLVTLQGSIGRVAITQYGAFVDRTVLIFNKYKDDIDKRFWAYIIKEKFEDEAKKAPGGTIKTITKEVLSDFNLMLPCYAEQSKVADYLISLDHLITLHQRKLDQLKALKKFMLQNLFI